MKVVGSVFLILIIFSLKVFACTCVLGDLSKRYKKADVVFVGELYDFEEEDIPNIQNFKKGYPVLNVKKAWKGVKSEFISIDFDFSNYNLNCPTFEKFEDNKDYLVFAYGKELKVQTTCSDTQELQPRYNSTIKEIEKLNSFWFRTWSKLKFF